MQPNTNSQERSTETKVRPSSSQSHTGPRVSEKPLRSEVLPEVGPKSVDPLTKRGAAGGKENELPGELPEKNIPESLPEDPGQHRQNPADPTRKEGDIPPMWAKDLRMQQGEDMEEPTPTREGGAIDRNPRNSGEVSKVY